MNFLQTVYKDTVDLEPEEFFKMRQETPDEISSFQVLPPILGKSAGFGKVRVKLSHPRYEVGL